MTKKLTSNTILSLLVFVGLFLLTANAHTQVEPEFERVVTVRFAVFSHVYPDYEALEDSLPKIEEINPDFVIFVGDSLPSHHETEWVDLLEITNQIGAPVHFVPGNHDIEDRAGDKEYFVENIGPLHKTFKAKGITFITLNSSNVAPLGNFDVVGKQVDWLKNIYKTDKRKKIVFVHHCLFYKDDGNLCNNRGRLLGSTSSWNENVVPTIKDDVLAVFVGDVGGSRHPYISYKENDIQYYGVGFTNNRLKYPQHFLDVKVFSDDSMSVKPVIIFDELSEVDSLYEIDLPHSFRENLSKFSYERFRGIAITYFKQISLGLAGLSSVLFVLVVVLSAKLYKRGKEKN